MGNLCSISISIDNLMNPCCTCLAAEVNYAFDLEENVSELRSSLAELKESRNDVRTKIEGSGRQPLERVQGWLSRVEAMETEVNELIEISSLEINRRCCFDCCPRNCCFARKLGKKVSKMLEAVAEMKQKGDFDQVVVERLHLRLSEVDERPSEATVGMESIFEKAWKHLHEEDVAIMGLYGLGGVGKTTLLTRINNQFANKSHDFDVVIWVVVSKDADMKTVQERIGEKIGFCDENWMRKTADNKAIDIYKVLSKKKFVLLLDDMWERFDLLKIGVPIPNRQNKSKLVFTTRSQDVCGRMAAQKKIQVECLPWVEAWNLFQDKVGEETLGSDTKISELAQEVARKCGGLPLALITIGRAMACKGTFQEWEYALQVLKRFAAEFSGMGDDVFPLLHFSYESLPSDKVKSCFLYCCLFPEDFQIDKEGLIDYLIGEGILTDPSGARNQGYDIIGTLLHACLLEEVSPYLVKMHDVIRDMALWIACEYGKAKNKFLVPMGMNLEPYGESNWKGVERMSLIKSSISVLHESPTCPKLTTLLLNENQFRDISVFCRFMPSLKVLDLSGNSEIKNFPVEICDLISLQYVNLSRSNIRELPVEFNKLVNLKVLNLAFMDNLYRIPTNVITCLSSLQTLRMLGGNLYAGETLIDELDCLKHLNFLNMTINCANALQKLSNSPKLLRCMRDLKLASIEGVISLHISSPDYMNNICSLRLDNCHALEEMVINWAVPGNHVQINSPHTPKIRDYHFFHVLESVDIHCCPRLKNLAWLVFAPRITTLRVLFCAEMKEVLCGGEHGVITEPVKNLNPFFGKLKKLSLIHLPQLKSICPGSLPFPCLKDVEVVNCRELKKLPLDCKSFKGRGIQIKGSQKWFDELVWEDEATRNAFLPSFFSS